MTITFKHWRLAYLADRYATLELSCIKWKDSPVMLRKFGEKMTAIESEASLLEAKVCKMDSKEEWVIVKTVDYVMSIATHLRERVSGQRTTVVRNSRTGQVIRVDQF